MRALQVSLHSQQKIINTLHLSIYDFEFAGDVLPMHTHDKSSAHITIVANGELKVMGNGWEKILTSGMVIDFPENQHHEFVSTKDNSRIINILKNPDSTQ